MNISYMSIKEGGGAKSLFRKHAKIICMDHYNINLIKNTLQVLNT